MKHRPQYYFHRPDNGVFAFAGIWSDRETARTCALITTKPNGVVGQIHDRMPVIVAHEDYAKWLDPATKTEELQELLRPVPDADLVVDPQGKELSLFDR
jgi:putative SOS response-associated peptidase YedK